MLVATKMEETKTSTQQECCERLLTLAKAHLSSLETNVFLVDNVIKTSSKDITKEMLENIYGKIVTMCMDKTLQNRPINSIPLIWFKEVDKIKLIKPAATLEDVTRILRAAHEEFASIGSNNKSDRELENLKKFKDILVLLITEQKRASPGCGSVMKHESLLKSCDHNNVDPMETKN